MLIFLIIHLIVRVTLSAIKNTTENEFLSLHLKYLYLANSLQNISENISENVRKDF